MKASRWKNSVMMHLVPIIYKPKITFEYPEVQRRELNEPCVIICNHVKVADGPIIRYAFNNRNVCSLMAKDIMENPLMSAVISGCQCIPVDRGSAATSWIHDCVKEIKHGNSVIIFPEGTTLKESELESFKSGFVLLAKTAGVKILPTAISYNNGVKIRVGKPEALCSEKMTRADIINETERFYCKVEDLYSQINGNHILSEQKNEITV